MVAVFRIAVAQLRKVPSGRRPEASPSMAHRPRRQPNSLSGQVSDNRGRLWEAQGRYRLRLSQAELTQWAGTVLRQQYNRDELRDCRPSHIHAIWELSTLAAEWQHAYGGRRAHEAARRGDHRFPASHGVGDDRRPPPRPRPGDAGTAGKGRVPAHQADGQHADDSRTIHQRRPDLPGVQLLSLPGGGVNRTSTLVVPAETLSSRSMTNGLMMSSAPTIITMTMPDWPPTATGPYRVSGEQRQPDSAKDPLHPRIFAHL
jgi:hypothetical protein